MTEKEKVYNLLNDGVKRSAKRIAQELNRPVPSVRRDLVQLIDKDPGRTAMKRERDLADGCFVYWRV